MTTNATIYSLLQTIHYNQTQIIIPLLRSIMTTETDFAAALQAISTAEQGLMPAVSEILAYIKTLQLGGTVPDAEIEAAATALTKVATDMSNAAKQLSGAIPPPSPSSGFVPPPSPPPGP
jgi:hypothetical protein